MDTTCQAALERLAAALDPAEYATTLTNTPERGPCLSVTSRNVPVGDDIWADHRAYYHSWGEWIAPVSDPQTAARMISMVLRAVPRPHMADSPPAPGNDEIILTAPDGRQVCHSRGHARLGVLAEVVVTFGELGARWQPDAVFQDCWGRSYPMCPECWQAVREVAQAGRPALVVTGTTTAPAG